MRRTDDAALSALLQEMHRQLWSPLAALLPAGTRTVILSPDGQLSFVSFATLLAPDRQFLAQKYSLAYVSSGRDLLREVKPGAAAELLVYANPDFSGQGLIAARAATNNLMAMREVEMRDFADVYLRPLPGTAKESAALEVLARGWAWPVKSYLGAEATEAQVRAVRSPRILHLATHGFFLPDTGAGGADSGAGVRGIGGMSSFGEANVGLRLEGTWLVVLSACDTGVGEARSGEGVLGLRRGFIQAGAQNLLMTLWPVADENTAKLMVDFYTAAHQTGNAPRALAEVQRDWLVRLRKEKGLAEAVRIAGPFIMSSQAAIR